MIEYFNIKEIREKISKDNVVFRYPCPNKCGYIFETYLREEERSKITGMKKICPICSLRMLEEENIIFIIDDEEWSGK